MKQDKSAQLWNEVVKVLDKMAWKGFNLRESK